jgi:hypothetical protein
LDVEECEKLIARFRHFAVGESIITRYNISETEISGGKMKILISFSLPDVLLTQIKDMSLF